MAGYGGGHPDECRYCGSPPWESCGAPPHVGCRREDTKKEDETVKTDVSCPTCGVLLGFPCGLPQSPPAPYQRCPREASQTTRQDSRMRTRAEEPPPSTPRYTADLMHAGRVLRYHTWAVHHQQTVGEHSWQVYRVYDAIFGQPGGWVAYYIMNHDSAELVMGDPPFPTKMSSPMLKAAYDSLEVIANHELGVRLPALDARERRRVKLCDLLEMAEFGAMEVEMGNRHACQIYDDTLAAVHALLDATHDEDVDPVLRYVTALALRHTKMMER